MDNIKAQASSIYQKILTLFGLDDLEGDTEIEQGEEKALYDDRPSFLEFLRFKEYDHETGLFHFDDGYGVGSMWRVNPINVDGFSEGFLYQVRKALTQALDTLPGHSKHPWVVQFFVKDEPIIDFEQQIRDYIAQLNATHQRSIGTPFTEQYVASLVEHANQLCEQRGIFEDGGAVFKGCQRNVRMCLYRLCDRTQAKKDAPEQEHIEVCERFIKTLKTNNIHAERMTGQHVYHWLFPWFNPAPVATNGDPYAWLHKRPYPVEEEKEGTLPLSFDLASLCFAQEPEALDPTQGVIQLNGGLGEYLSLSPISTRPDIGHFGVEKKQEGAEPLAALLDRLPPDSTFSMTITILNQDDVVQTCDRTLDQLRGLEEGKSASADQTKYQARSFKDLKEAYNFKGYHLQMGVYLTASTMESLEKRRKTTEQVMLNGGIPIIRPSDDLVRQNSFLRQLPFSYNPAYAKSERRAGLTYAHHVANLIPLYGRATGSGNHGFMFWNRSGEVFSFDPFNKADRTRAAHGLLLGPTGAGKSAMTTYLLEHMMAMLRPQVFLVESGNSFGPFAEHATHHGLKVVHKRLSANSKTGLSPFADALKALAQFEQQSDEDEGVSLEESLNATDDFIDNAEKAFSDVEKDDDTANEDDKKDESRDILGEMELSARLMITGGEEKEEAKFERPDRILIREAILDAATYVRDASQSGELERKEVIASDIVDALLRVAEDENESERRRKRAEYMADSMKLFTKPGSVEARFFNKPGQAWESDADVTIVDLDLFARKGMEAQLAVVMTGLLNRINGIAEDTQYNGRPIIVWIDEAHIATTNPLLAPYIATIGKMWRKLGTWLWLATQNMKDFPDVSSKMLSMAEFWICLVPPEDEIEHIQRFMSLTEDEIQLLRETRKAPPKYVEGVVLSPKFKALFRNIPPSNSLALAMTEEHEKSERALIMKEKICTEVEAVYEVARKIREGRNLFKESQL